MEQKRLTSCPICEGTGEVSRFGGVSRFFLSNEPCPHCLGLGQIDEGESHDDTQDVQKSDPGQNPDKPNTP
ncbi:MAG: hypothetical protein H8E79_08090 [Desulfobulbaceae bacterium]|uniref:Chaperone protein DnaJ n=1 Tax=Candidatus Desulfatifera sulfidica TaxID=2841691 RepID=A0A8J6TED9_9BACT|nr:hypothetical protein [Candidatus Desulfatifera sulfidica]